MRTRFVLYAAVLGFLGFIVVADPFATAKEPPFWTLHGTTNQGDDIKLRLDRDGRVRTFEVRVDMYCCGGRIAPADWHPSEGGPPARFGSRGPRFDALELRHSPSGAALHSALRGSVAHGRASGIVEMTLGGRGREDCDSGPVAWTAA
jgi:hypothetical protein